MLIIVIVMAGGDVKLKDFNSVINIGLEYFVLLFCTQGVYNNNFGGGMDKGKLSDLYLKAKERYEELKEKIIASGQAYRMEEFCAQYVEELLRKARKNELMWINMDYDTYQKYIKLDDETILSDSELSEKEKQIIIKANSIKPLKLSADEIIQKELLQVSDSVSPTHPKIKKEKKCLSKLTRMAITSAFVSPIAFRAAITPNLATFAAIAFKMFFVVMTGFAGNSDGYDNITVDTVNYIDWQTNLEKQFLEYIERVPVEEVKKEVA